MKQNLKNALIGGLLGFATVATSLGIGVYAGKSTNDTLTATEWNRLVYRVSGQDDIQKYKRIHPTGTTKYSMTQPSNATYGIKINESSYLLPTRPPNCTGGVYTWNKRVCGTRCSRFDDDHCRYRTTSNCSCPYVLVK